MIKSRIAGIPCLIKSTRVLVVPGSYSYNAASDMDYHGFTEVDFEVYDRKGYQAPWLERKMTKSDRQDIEAQILEEEYAL